MKEYIDRNALLKDICGNDPSHMEDYYFNAIANAPTADVVEVVRCKDCKYWEYDKRSYDRGYHFGECTCPHWEGSSVWDRHDTTIDDYCSQGKRKEQK